MDDAWRDAAQLEREAAAGEHEQLEQRRIEFTRLHVAVRRTAAQLSRSLLRHPRPSGGCGAVPAPDLCRLLPQVQVARIAPPRFAAAGGGTATRARALRVCVLDPDHHVI